MEFHHLPILSLFLLVLEGSHASVPPMVYWQSVLPNTPMPNALQDLLLPDTRSNKAQPDTYDELVHVESIPQYRVYRKFSGEELKEMNKHANSSTNIFFLYNDLRLGKKMRLLFTYYDRAAFLPREEVESIPFSSDKFPEILNHFSVNATSKKAHFMKETLYECEAPKIKGEDKYCATSLESLVDFCVAKLGKKVLALTNEIEVEENKKCHDYKILGGVEMLGEEHVVCHKARYACAVFLCHTSNATKLYRIPLVGDDGMKVKALAICHMNTSNWNPKYIAFQRLNVKPGGPPICHFLNNDALVWVPN